MKKNLNYFITAGLSVLLCFLLLTCKKDGVKCLECDKCDNFPKQKGVTISSIKQKTIQHKAPCFNPNNGNEFIYVKIDNNVESLRKYNLITRTEQVLLNNIKIVGQPKWGENHLIMLTQMDLKIYLMKENGDSLYKVTHYFENNDPSFLQNDKIFYSVGVETSPGASGNKIINYFGTMIDSIKPSDSYIPDGGVFGINDINANGQIVSWTCGKSGNCSMVFFYFDKKVYQSVYDFEFTGRNNIEGIVWHPNNEDIYYSTYREGLFKVNTITKKRVMIRNGCDARSYRFLSISPDGTKIIVERVDASDYNNTSGSWTEESDIYIMDIDGEHESKALMFYSDHI